MLTTAGNFYVIIHGESFLHFYNCVNQAVMQLDHDPTEGLRKSDFRGNAVFGILFVVCFILFATNTLHSLEEVSAFLIQAVWFLFNSNLAFVDHQPFWARDYEEQREKCDNVCKGCRNHLDADYDRCKDNNCFNPINNPSTKFRLIKWTGFLIFVRTPLEKT